MVCAISAFLEFCYLVRRNTIDDNVLKQIDEALERYHQEREIFITTGVRETISLPRQHAMKHYVRLIRLFGSPNGLCSSMMEAKHIVAVKRPYRRSSKNKALGQIIKTNERIDKLGAFRDDLTARGMLDGPCPRLEAFLCRFHAAQDSQHDGSSSDSDSGLSHADHTSAYTEQRTRTPASTRTTGKLVLLPSQRVTNILMSFLASRRTNNPAHTPTLDDDDDDDSTVDDPTVLAEVVLAKTPSMALL